MIKHVYVVYANEVEIKMAFSEESAKHEIEKLQNTSLGDKYPNAQFSYKEFTISPASIKMR